MLDTFPSQGPNHTPTHSHPRSEPPPGTRLIVPTPLCRPQAPSLDPRMEGAETDPFWAAASAPGVSGSRARCWVCEGRKGAAWQTARRVPSPLGLGSLSLAGGWTLNRWANTEVSVCPGDRHQSWVGVMAAVPPTPWPEQATVRRAGGDGGKGPSQCKGPGVKRRLEDLRVKKGRGEQGLAEPWRKGGFVQKEREGGEGSCISSC